MKTESIKSNRDFKRVYRKGKSVVGRHFVIYFVRNNLGKNRIGFTVSKKVGKAVVRNHVRRRLKESFRSHEDSIRCCFDIVIVARVSSKDQTYGIIDRDMKKMLLGNIARKDN